MRLSSLSTYRQCDARVVLAACKHHGISFRNRLGRGDKYLISNHTGLNIRTVEKALTDLRKSQETT